MKASVHILPRGRTAWLLAGIIAAAMLALTSDRTPATAATTEIGPTLVATGTSGCGNVCAPAWVSNVSLLKGGHAGTLSPCPESDPTTSCLSIWGKNADATSTGVSAFQVEVTYDSSRIHVAALTGSTVWLSSAGRGASCPAAVIEEDPGTGYGHAATNCFTLGSTGAGPKCPSKCNGLLATLQIESVPSAPAGQSAFTIDYSSGALGGSLMLDMTCTDHCGQLMPATVHSMTARIVKCANLVPDADNNVLVNDIVYMVNRYRTHGMGYPNPGDPASALWDERTDLDANNQVLVSDIAAGVNQYRKPCIA